MAGKIVKVAALPTPSFTHSDAEDVLATLCFYYPQYTFSAARRLPHKTVLRLMKTARRLEAKNYFMLTQIAAAPHTEKGQGVQDLLAQFEDQVNNG